MDVKDKFDHLEILVALGLMPQSVLETLTDDRVLVPCQDDEDEDEE